ncbi:TIGR02594 family protein [Methylobacterium phyllostachyos]|uniref:NlpC/P60 family protein n=1 Tax=Methylobacterium phyllostachyos TaxID=582672 RepID=UPI001AD8108D
MAFGRQTIAAVRAFQSRVGLDPDGIVGPLTLPALFPDRRAETDLDQASLVWFKEAKRLLGTREDPSRGSNPDIINWATEQGIRYSGDDIPWCGLFVGHCISSTLDREPIPANVLSARAWSRFGIKTSPTPGAIMVFWRKSIQSGLGHVGFYAGEDDSAYRILGGNQSDSVSLAWIRMDRLVDARWPSTVPQPMPRV